MTLTEGSRRGILLGGACLFGCAAAPRILSAKTGADCPDLIASPPVSMTPAEQERHFIYLSLAMSMLCDGWGVDPRDPERVAAYAAEEPGRRFADYLGHNIGALLVDRSGAIVCFALNRNVQLNSTLEHAEARSVRAAIQRANAAQPPNGPPPWTFGSLLLEDCLYTTLEPCAQCAGIMDLARVGTVIYAQDDPGQRHIVNVLYNLGVQPRGPLPVRGTFLPAWPDLAAAYRRFSESPSRGPRTGVTSFLETLDAFRIYRRAAAAFEKAEARHAANDIVLRDARAFRERWRGTIQSGLVPV